jgi:hypothetical protein
MDSVKSRRLSRERGKNMNQITIDGYRRINKTNARKLYNRGVEIVLCPNKMRPFTPWQFEIRIKRKLDWTATTFDKVVNEFEYYNCTNTETGYRTSYYARETDIENTL